MPIKEKFEQIKVYEGDIKNIKKQIDLLNIDIAKLDKQASDLWLEIKEAVDATDNKEVVLPGDFGDLKIHYKKGVEKIDIVDVEELPEEFIKVERTAKKRELLAYFKTLRDDNLPFPNYATITQGESVLTYSLIKE